MSRAFRVRDEVNSVSAALLRKYLLAGRGWYAWALRYEQLIAERLMRVRCRLPCPVGVPHWFVRLDGSRGLVFMCQRCRAWYPSAEADRAILPVRGG